MAGKVSGKEGASLDVGRLDFLYKFVAADAFFASDFVIYNVLKTLLGVTVSYILIFGIYAVCHLDTILAEAANFQLAELFRSALKYYVILLIIYGLFSAAVYAWRYHKSHERVRVYYRMLKLIEKYGQEGRK